ncbi:MAG: hypothetical protein IPK76_11840 [Lewinellaceae bacterium]|nr:hypothetical protein [Lewinellaceae bacterium]
MTESTRIAGFFMLLLLAFACSRQTRVEDTDVWKKVFIDFSRLDENGLAGPPSGKVALNYEFCIPAEEQKWRAVQKIDPGAQVQKGSRGRSGCEKASWLVIGSTHQKNYKRVIYELASLPYVARIQETFFE